MAQKNETTSPKRSERSEKVETQKNISRVISAKDIDLSSEKKILDSLSYSNCIRALIQGWRQGTVSCKTRGEIAFSNKKPWRQKGTGRARVGSRRSPLWRKGGIIFGPQPRVRELKVNKKLRKQALNSLLWNYLDQKAIVSLNWAPEGQYKTSAAYKLLKDNNLSEKKLIIFTSLNDYSMYNSFANLPNVRLMLFDEPNVYSLSKSDCWIILDKDFNSFKEMVSSWN